MPRRQFDGAVLSLMRHRREAIDARTPDPGSSNSNVPGRAAAFARTACSGRPDSALGVNWLRRAHTVRRPGRSSPNRRSPVCSSLARGVLEHVTALAARRRRSHRARVGAMELQTQAWHAQRSARVGAAGWTSLRCRSARQVSAPCAVRGDAVALVACCDRAGVLISSPPWWGSMRWSASACRRPISTWPAAAEAPVANTPARVERPPTSRSSARPVLAAGSALAPSAVTPSGAPSPQPAARPASAPSASPDFGRDGGPIVGW